MRRRLSCRRGPPGRQQLSQPSEGAELWYVCAWIWRRIFSALVRIQIRNKRLSYEVFRSEQSEREEENDCSRSFGAGCDPGARLCILRRGILKTVAAHER